MKLGTFFWILLAMQLQAQQVQWASKVVSYSSDLGGKQFGIKQILGKPNAFPQCESSPTAWMPKSALSGAQVLEVAFEKEQTVQQIAIFENLNSGCVKVISVAGSDNKYKEVWRWTTDWRNQPFKRNLKTDRSYYFNRKRRKVEPAPPVDGFPGIHRVLLVEPVANVKSVRIKFDFSILPGQKQIDAIGISDSNIPIEAEINSISNNLIESAPELLVNNCYSFTCTEDGNQLFFTRDLEGKQVVYSSNFTKLSEVSQVNVCSANLSYNYLQGGNGNLFLHGGATYSASQGETGWNLLEYKNGNFQNLGKLRIAAYSNYGETADATITSDGKIVILAVESDLTQGGSDLYLARRKDDGTYTYLENLGKQLNTAADELAPFLCADNKTLLFASNGFSGYGGMDIFVSKRLDDTFLNWSEPKNLGNLVNSDANEVGAAITAKNQLLVNKQTEDGSAIFRLKLKNSDFEDK
ncbi:PD40 domain-containing protein [Flavobacterium aurantiibacter]|nr:PD40 domain-containing protein [Flavobacterium aurantiibacter]